MVEPKCILEENSTLYYNFELLSRFITPLFFHLFIFLHLTDLVSDRSAFLFVDRSINQSIDIVYK